MKSRSRWSFIALVCLLVASSLAPICQAEDDPSPLPPAVNKSVDFLNDVRPILREHCFECHAGNVEEAGLNLGIKNRALAGGDSGSAIRVGKGHRSLLIQLVSGIDKDRMMPPEDHQPLTAKQIGILRAWIDQGAEWPDDEDVLDPQLDRAKNHWAFRRLRAVNPPHDYQDDGWSQTPIDPFVHRQLQMAELGPSKSASARTLVRRIYFDLIGLPPDREQTGSFMAAYSKDPASATELLIDQLLNSPHYGERWARHWLDVARYADSNGQELDEDRPHAYHYRDFVIQAFNDDMPYDQFVRWQIAGDELEPDHDQAVAATGFLTAGPSFKLDDKFLERERLFNRYNELDDIISTIGSGLLGLTVGCARCHDHKYDAFSSREYYQLLGVFHSGDRVAAKLPSGKDGFFFQDFDHKVRTTWLFRRSDFYDREIEVGLGFPTILSHELKADQYWAAAKEATKKYGAPKSTLQRRALADWITDTEHGAGVLLARVFVNRVWQHHFGQGLVRTPSDFGVRGEAPTHPELLEYLTNYFVANGWQLKPLHRLILNSATWQQASTRGLSDQRGAEVDTQNELLWKMLPQRLEAEILRDAMLSISGTLNLKAGGPGFKPYIPPEANLARNIKGGGYPKDAKDDASTRRRSVYMFHKRLIPYPMFQAFDRPDLMTSCARRQNTTVAPQAMAILNDRFVRSVARDFAAKLLNHSDAKDGDAHDSDGDLQPLVHESFQASFARSPTKTEMETSIRFIESQAQSRSARGETNPRVEAVTDFCHSLYGLNEFIYVD